MNATDIFNHFMAKADWVDPATTVDGVIVGDPKREIGHAVVTWISSFDAVREAVRRGAELLITHEPTFWTHRDELTQWQKTELFAKKKGYIEEHGLVILRNHDVWDVFPELGIPWAWARFLELGDQPAARDHRGYQHRYDIEPVSVDELAERIAAKTATIGEPTVHVIGDGAQIVSRVGTGTGCGCDTHTYVEMGCDVSVVCDDGVHYWGQIQYAQDLGHPVIRVNHGTSEEPGMMTLTQYVAETFPTLKVGHLPHPCFYRQIGG